MASSPCSFATGVVLVLVACKLTLSGGPRYVSERYGNTNNSVVAKD